MIFGLAAVGYNAGAAGYFLGFGYFLGLLFIGKSIHKVKSFMSENDCDLVDDFIALKFGDGARIFFGIIQFLILLCIVGAQFVALNLLIEMYGVDYYNLGFILLLTVILYASFSGFKGVVKTDKIQLLGFLIPVLFLGIPILLNHFDIVLDITFDEKKIGSTSDGYGIPFIVGAVILFAPSIFVRNEFWQRVRAAKNSKVATNAFVVAAISVFIIYFIITSLGMIASEVIPNSEESQLSMLELMKKEGWLPLSVINIGLLVTIILTLTSTIDSYLNVATSVVSKIVDKAKWSKYYEDLSENVDNPAFENLLIKKLRIFSIIIGSIGVLLAAYFSSVVDIVVGASSSLIVFLPVTFYAVVFASKDKNRVSSSTAILSLALGYLTFIAFIFILNVKTAFVPGFIVAFLTFIVGRMIDIRLNK